jgi:hypothetical protein
MFKEILVSDKRSLNPYAYDDRLNVLSTYNMNDNNNRYYHGNISPDMPNHHYDDNDKRYCILIP